MNLVATFLARLRHSTASGAVIVRRFGIILCRTAASIVYRAAPLAIAIAPTVGDAAILILPPQEGGAGIKFIATGLAGFD